MFFGKILRVTLIFAFLLLPTAHCLLPTVHAAPLTEESTLDIKKSDTPQVKNDGAGLYVSFIKLFAGLAVVVGVMLIVYYFAKDRLGKAGLIPGKGRLINVIATQYVAPKKSIMVIEVAGEYMVVGVGEEINLLARIGDLSQEPEVKSQKADFSEHLRTASVHEGATGIIESIKASVERLKGRR